MKKNYKAALFDVDGTLLDSLLDIVEAVNQTRHAWGLPTSEPQGICRWIGQGAEYLIRGSLPEIPESKVAHATEQYKHYYASLSDPQSKLYPGVEQTLLNLVKTFPGIKLGVVTNKATHNAESVLNRLIKEVSFGVIAGPERVSAHKPNPAHLLEVLAQLHVEPEDAFFVGDDPVDQKCAQGAGVTFLAATYGIGGVVETPPYRLSQFSDLLPALELIGFERRRRP